MGILLIIFFIQCVIAVVAIFILKKLLDKELMEAALEKLESCKASEEVKEISVHSATEINPEYKSRIQSVCKRKFAQARLDILLDPLLKGGVVIKAGEYSLDFSLSNRLQNFWS